MKNIQPLHLILGGCGLAILGCFLPWASISFKTPLPGMGSSHSASGIDTSRGVITLLLAVAAIVLHFVKVPGKDKLMALIAIICAGLAALIGIYSMIDLKDTPSGMELFTDGFSVSIGIGLYLVVLGGLIGAFGWFQRFQIIPGPIVPPSLPPPVPPAPPPAPPAP